MRSPKAPEPQSLEPKPAPTNSNLKTTFSCPEEQERRRARDLTPVRREHRYVKLTMTPEWRTYRQANIVPLMFVAVVVPLACSRVRSHLLLGIQAPRPSSDRLRPNPVGGYRHLRCTGPPEGGVTESSEGLRSRRGLRSSFGTLGGHSDCARDDCRRSVGRDLPRSQEGHADLPPDGPRQAHHLARRRYPRHCVGARRAHQRGTRGTRQQPSRSISLTRASSQQLLARRDRIAWPTDRYRRAPPLRDG